MKKLVVYSYLPEHLKMYKMLLAGRYEYELFLKADEAIKRLSDDISGVLVGHADDPGLCITQAAKQKNLPVLLTTASPSSRIHETFKEAGAREVLEKIFSKQELLSALERVVG